MTQHERETRTLGRISKMVIDYCGSLEAAFRGCRAYSDNYDEFVRVYSIHEPPLTGTSRRSVTSDALRIPGTTATPLHRQRGGAFAFCSGKATRLTSLPRARQNYEEASLHN